MKNEKVSRILDGNISRLNAKASSVRERYNTFVYEKMKLLSHTALHDLSDEFLSSAQIFSQENDVHGALMLTLNGADILSDMIFDTPKIESLFSEVGRVKREPVVAFLDNAPTREAFMRFFPRGEAHAEQYYDFLSACEALYTSKCDMCILPIENSSDGRLSSFCTLIKKYELFITSVADVTNSDLSLRTRYALLSGSLTLDIKTDDICCKLQFDMGGDRSISEVLTATEYFGVKCIGTDSVPEAYRTDNSSCTFTLKGKYGDVFKLLFYFYLTKSTYIPLGIYDAI